ncbi:MAG: M1 family metallopeptidase [Bacteroidia bacterium]|nr:M1 family metallopeptidase [Bacteroidia bacterium]
MKFIASILIIVLTCTFYTETKGQNYNPNKLPNTYQSQQNPLYWKNKMPFAGYWQQDVHYKIDAEINSETDIIDATQQLDYYNNSPDTLFVLYFHLYQNAFQPGSYYDKFKNANNEPQWFGKYERQKLGTTISKIKVSNNSSKNKFYTPDTIHDNSIFIVKLNSPLPPNQNVKIEIDFKTYFDKGSMRRRMDVYSTFGQKHYNGVHWYPRMCVYDRKFGWHTDQHLGKEFYGDFGTFDVKLTFPNHFIVEGTGTILNRDKVLPESLRKKLDIQNFKDKPLNSPPSTIISNNGTKKTWHFYAENIHDFGFTADPHYRIQYTYSKNGTECIALAQEQVAAKWQNASDYAAKCIDFYESNFEKYEWPKIIVADARSGMEYNMMTLDGGTDPGYRGLLAHEIGHMWFYGMLGTNEAYRAYMDEGFTQYLTAKALTHIDGKYGPPKAFTNNHKMKYTRLLEPRYERALINYITFAHDEKDGQLETHSHEFGENLAHRGPYGQVYRKGASMLYNLEYVLGEELFNKAMRHYVKKWKIAHPYPEDFKKAFIEYTHVDLNWFFDQWLETDKQIDYKIKSVNKIKGSDNYEITFKRMGRMQMPIDFTVINNDGKRRDYHVPNTYFVKNTNAKVLPAWKGWDKLNETYTAVINSPDGIKSVQIDTTYRLADVNQLNNSKSIPFSLTLDAGIKTQPRWEAYDLKLRPDIWWNEYDGLKTGFHLEGDYMQHRHKVVIDAWINTGMAQGGLEQTVDPNLYDNFSFRATYSTPMNWLFKNSGMHIMGQHLDGLTAGSLKFDWTSKNKNVVAYTMFKSMVRNNTSDLDYLLYPDEWLSSRVNNTLHVGFDFTKKYYKGMFTNNSFIKTSVTTSDYNFTQVGSDLINRKTLGKFKVSTRLFGVLGTGVNMPRESALFLAGANPEEMMDNKYVRSIGLVPTDWLGFGDDVNHFHHGGGLNLRGYSGYLAPEDIDGSQTFTYKGLSGASFNAEIDFANLFNLKPRITKDWLKLDTYLFFDGGFISTNLITESFEMGEIRTDAGIGSALTIKKFGPFETAKPLTIRFDMPLVLNRTPAESPDYVQFRWIVGVNRAF